MSTVELSSLSAHELAALVGAIVAAADAGWFAQLVRGARSREALCAGADELASDRVLALLCAAGIVEGAEGGALRLNRALGHDGPLVPGGVGALVNYFAHVPAFLKRGARVATMDGDGAERERAYQQVVSELAALFGAAAEALATRLPPARHVLDIGAGSGVWSLAMLQRAPDARATAHDLAGVLPAFLRRAEQLGLSARVATLPGDYHDSDLPDAAFDRALLGNVLHLESERAAEALVQRVARSLAPGAELVVIDVFAHGPGAALAHAAYELHLAMRTGGGRAHSRAQIEAWLRIAGLAPGALIDLGAQLRGMAALVARKPR